ncbi:MAG TPA: type II toxin-antitoxin system RelE/ParE family toxin [Acidimicrobiales bacterium]|nr:type II toxin-antitoxin system RelE/ParE family toxin [Acidimicrobiales bacterium]
MTSEPFDVEWASSALRSLDRLPEKIATACVEFAYGGLAENPRRVGRALRFDLEGKHSARRGDFRVIYEIDDRSHVVTIIAIDHRSDIYRPR